MTFPSSVSRLASITGFPAWRAAVERALGDLDARIAATRSGAGRPAARMAYAAPAAPTTGSPGEAYVWTGTGIPYGALPADGSLVSVEDYPYLYAVLSDLYATNDEPPGTFRLPDLAAPTVGVWVVRT